MIDWWAVNELRVCDKCAKGVPWAGDGRAMGIQSMSRARPNTMIVQSLSNILYVSSAGKEKSILSPDIVQVQVCPECVQYSNCVFFHPFIG